MFIGTCKIFKCSTNYTNAFFLSTMSYYTWTKCHNPYNSYLTTFYLAISES